MDLERARYLVSTRGREALESVPADAETLDANRLATLLRRTYPPGEAAALAEQITLRAKARSRFGDAFSEMLYTGPGLEMMTHPAVAARRAARLAAAGLPVADLMCGIGGDLGAVAATGLRATGLERDDVTAILARTNVPGAAIVRGDAAEPPLDQAKFAVIVDPARRSAAGRRFDPRAFSPDWDTCVALVAEAALGVLKAPPGLGHEHVPPWAELEAVQLGRDLREIALWGGAATVPGLRRAVLLPAGVEITSELPESEGTVGEPRPYLFDPESCVTRAGLVRHLAALLGADLMDGQVAYLTSQQPAFHPMAATFETLEVLPFSVQALKNLLRSRGWRPHEIRRRAFPVEPDELRRLLGRIEGEPVTVVCTTLNGARTIAVGRRLYEPGRLGA